MIKNSLLLMLMFFISTFFISCATVRRAELNKLRCEKIKTDLIHSYFLTKESQLFGLSISLKKAGIPDNIIFSVLQASDNAIAKAAVEYQYEHTLDAIYGNIIENADCLILLEK